MPTSARTPHHGIPVPLNICPGTAGNGTRYRRDDAPGRSLLAGWANSPSVGIAPYKSRRGAYDNTVVSVSWAKLASASCKIVRPADSWVLSQISSTDSP